MNENTKKHIELLDKRTARLCNELAQRVPMLMIKTEANMVMEAFDDCLKDRGLSKRERKKILKTMYKCGKSRVNNSN